jgi:hypothetical protein
MTLILILLLGQIDSIYISGDTTMVYYSNTYSPNEGIKMIEPIRSIEDTTQEVASVESKLVFCEVYYHGVFLRCIKKQVYLIDPVPYIKSEKWEQVPNSKTENVRSFIGQKLIVMPPGRLSLVSIRINDTVGGITP